MDLPDISQRNALYNENKNFIDENNILRAEFENLKKQIIILKREKNKLENEKNSSKNENINSNDENKTLQNELNIKIDNSQINNSNNEIKNIKINNNINFDDIIRDKLILIKFITKDQKAILDILNDFNSLATINEPTKAQGLYRKIMNKINTVLSDVNTMTTLYSYGMTVYSTLHSMGKI